MPFKPGREPGSPDFKRLLGTLHHSEIKTKDNALYQVVKSLIDWSNQQAQVTNSQIGGINQTISEIPSGGGGGGGGVVEPVVDHDHIPMVTGAEPLELMSDGAGNLIVVEYDE